jgi:hypothetical protein
MKITKNSLRQIVKEEVSKIMQENMPALAQKVKRDLGPGSQADEELKQAFRNKYARKANKFTGREKNDPWGLNWVEAAAAGKLG